MQDKGFFGALFDFSFSSFVTTKIIKFLYILIIIGLVVWLVASTVMQGFMGFVVGVIGAAVMFLLSRIYLELMIVVFRMAENLELIAGRSGAQAPNLPPLTQPGPATEE